MQIESDSPTNPPSPQPKDLSPKTIGGIFEDFVFTPDSLIGDPIMSPTPELVLQKYVHWSPVRTNFGS